MKIIIAILAILLMIILHEWGHFIAARLCKVPVYEFSVGMGPLIKQGISKKGTKISLRAIPIGGYCAFDDTQNASFEDAALETISPLKKIFICFMGPFMNLLTAYIILIGITAIVGKVGPLNHVESTMKGFPAENVLQQDDIITEINGIKIDEENTVAKFVDESEGNPLTIKFLRNNEEITAVIAPIIDESAGDYKIGINYKNDYVKATPLEIFTVPFKNCINFGKTIFNGLKMIITRKAKSSEISGIVGVVSIMSEYATRDAVIKFLNIMALISINLGIVNLLPIPALDGAKILTGIYEMIFKRKIPRKIEENAAFYCFILLMFIMVLTFINDIINIINKIL